MIELTAKLVLALRAHPNQAILTKLYEENYAAGFSVYYKNHGLHLAILEDEVHGYMWEALLELIKEYDPSKEVKPLTRWLCLFKYAMRATQKQSKYRASVKVPYDPRCPQYQEIRFMDVNHQEMIMNHRHNVAWSDENHNLVEETL